MKHIIVMMMILFALTLTACSEKTEAIQDIENSNVEEIYNENVIDDEFSSVEQTFLEMPKLDSIDSISVLRFENFEELLEKEDDVGWGISCRNSGVVHAGFNSKPGTLMAKFCVEGNKSFAELCNQLDVPYKKIGKLVVAKKKEEIKGLQKLKQQGDTNGVNNLQIINLNEVKRLEPNIEGIAALYSPETAITSPYLLTIALAENALDNGVSFFLNTEVESITRLNNSRFKIITNKREFTSSYVINSAGLYGDKIARMVGINNYRLYPCRGEYHILDKNVSWLINHLIYPVPQAGAGGLGIHLTPTIDGNILIGPSNEYIKSKDNLSITSSLGRYKKILVSNAYEDYM